MSRLAALVLFAGLWACGPSEAEQAEACAKGVPEAEASRELGQCIYRSSNGRCFEDADIACVCEGCDPDQCAIGESAPAVLLCQ